MAARRKDSAGGRLGNRGHASNGGGVSSALGPPDLTSHPPSERRSIVASIGFLDNTRLNPRSFDTLGHVRASRDGLARLFATSAASFSTRPFVSSDPGIPPDDALVPALFEEIRTPPVAGPRKPAVGVAHDRAVGSINNTHHIAAALGDEVHGVAFVLVARNECGRIRNRLGLELTYHCRQPRGPGVSESGATGLRPHPADRTTIRRTRLTTREMALPPL